MDCNISHVITLSYLENDESPNNNVIITQHNSKNVTKLASIDVVYIIKQFNSFIDIRFLGPKPRFQTTMDIEARSAERSVLVHTNRDRPGFPAKSRSRPKSAYFVPVQPGSS